MVSCNRSTLALGQLKVSAASRKSQPAIAFT